MHRRPTERIHARENRVATKGMLNSSTNVKRDEIFTICSNLFVQLEGLKKKG
jgi:hypothetical protein